MDNKNPVESGVRLSKTRLAGAAMAVVFFASNVQAFAQQDQNPHQLPPPDQPRSTQPAPQQPPATPEPTNPSPNTPVNPPAQSTPTMPSGTAAAPAGRLSGNAASRPAGAAIAPPKQRQVRSFLIKLGFVAGAAAALGTVAALSMASPARVPNSH
jgi:hypothetical protein